MAYYRSTKSMNFDHTTSDRSVSETEALIEAKQRDYIKICEQKAKIDKKAQRRAKALLALGSSVVIGQFGFIMAGTFLYLSWDIMEPISYVMMLGNFTFGMLFYAKYKEDF
jgi:hypothetical protein